MKEMLKSLYETKGIQIPEQDLDSLAAIWSSLSQLKPSVDGTFNIALLNIPNGGKYDD